ncbi:response regulator [Flavobacterium muglaense]|uniref:Response regulator n=1 Tax=Flavobacterium muglaense TaxID=2764716 RepID=A0A923SE90_9FLAO|nr:response regulator [Flavobacterium muglaense]MBC5836589.1 response regulator [Flavobacterium muglaense]MBC5843145.1 response regulator [Flavobacterium muglaense]
MLDLILCVDDDPITLMLCKKVIQKSLLSKEIITAQNGEEALEYFKNLNDLKSQNTAVNLPQLVFLDLNMPVMGGWEFLDEFNTTHYKHVNTIKIVVLSSTVDPDDLEKANTYPMVLDFLPKPITTSMLKYVTSKVTIAK